MLLVTLDATSNIALAEKLADDTYSLLVTLESNGKLPTELKLFNSGITDTTKGKFLFDDMSAKNVMLKLQELGRDKLPFDYGHGMVQYGGEQKAAGWFVPEVRAGALWATQIEWTPKATQELGDKEWRYYSPAFKAFWPDDPNEAAVIRELINCALTNLPATKNQKPIVASATQGTETETRKPIMKLILQKLGVSEEHEATERVTQLLSNEASNVSLLSSLGFKTIAELGAAYSNGQSQVKTMKTEARKAKIAALSSEGRLEPAQHAFAESLSDEQFESFIGTLPKEPLTPKPVKLSVAPATPGSVSARVPVTSVTLSDEEREMARQFNQDPSEMLSIKQELNAGPHPFQYVPKQTKTVKLPE